MIQWFIGIIVGLFSCTISFSALAQGLIDVDYDPEIPTLKQDIGYVTGERITTPEHALSYLRALQSAAPERMSIQIYATSWQGRELVTALITSPENMLRLDEIKTDLKKLASGDKLEPDERRNLIARTPAVTWLSYGVHGDEISSTDAALGLAYHLLAARGDDIVDTILKETIVVIDPMQNPDGRARFVHSFESSLGLEPLADRYSAEHDQPWPSGRYNHYLFDLNRDWFALSQPETRGKVKAILDWNPVVVVDAHEMNGDESYFFAPAAEPFNPGITDSQRQKQTLFGQNHAKWFDKLGFEYFTREVYDQFYPGYGDMWPTLNGAIAMTYEQGSVGGLRFEKTNGEEITYLDSIQHHFISTLSTAEVVAKNKQLFLSDYADYRASAVKEGRASKQRYFIVDRSQRAWDVNQFAKRFILQGIHVFQTDGSRSLCGQKYPKGAIIIDQAQPNGRLIKTLLADSTPLPVEFLEEQESRRDRSLPHELYDVTAWSVPMMDGLSVSTCKSVDLSKAVQVYGGAVSAIQDTSSAAFGYAVPWTDTGQAKLILAALAEGFTGKATDKAYTVGDREYPRGTTIFPTKGNPENLATRLNALSLEVGAELVPMQSSWVDEGPNFGSNEFRHLKSPKIALAWGEGTVPTDTGATRFIIERNLGVPVSPIRVRTLGRADLEDYDVLILPQISSNFSSELGESGVEALKLFVSDGGVLIGFSTALNVLIDEDIGLLSTSLETMFFSDEDDTASKDDDEDGGPVPGTKITSEEGYKASIADPDKKPDSVPGVLLHAIANTDHWLSAGYEQTTALLTGNRIYRPLNEADGTNVFRFAGPDDLLASGYLWEENRHQLAFKPFVMAQPHGDGMVIGFTQSPTTRAYLNGLTLLLANAIILGPAHTD
ncbi:MAG: carboxypeptidase [Robiginitomaculum sp.]|nr:carboxypeptidase [Robiginitomaculum sp.]